MSVTKKYKFQREYPFRTSPKVIYSYLSTAGGLEQWFAEKVSIDGDHVYSFLWDGVMHKAMLTSARANKSVKFEFMDDAEDNNYLELKLESSEFDGSTYLKITDYSASTDEDDLIDLWDGMVSDLRDIVGG